jgi:pimeloyl-ACP methyl ester carboxylesterase
VDAPGWFTDALAATVEDGFVDVDGCSIHYRWWGDGDRPALVLVHGGAAHSQWWDHVGPMLANEYCVAAIDMSGHGDSDRRETYRIADWAREIVAVAGEFSSHGPPVIVAHSMGGWVGMATAAHHGDAIGGLILLDSAVFRRDPEADAADRGTAFAPRLKTYSNLDEALARFRPVPDQPTSLPYVIEHVARTSLREVDGGWQWKFDPKVLAPVGEPGGAMLDRITSRIALFRAEFGLVTEDIGRDMYEGLGRVAPVIEVPLAWHHIMLDQPIALVTGLRALLADWQHSDPFQRG